MIADDEESVKKKIDKTCTDNLTVSLDTTCDVKKSEKGDAEDPKPRIVLTIRSEKSSAKSNNMKIVSTEEKLEEVSPRRSSRTRGKWEWVCDSDTSVSPKKYKSASENDDSDAHNAKRSTSRRSKDTDNVVANAIARKEKLYEDITPQRTTRRQKPKGAEEMVEKQGDRVKTRRSARPTATETQKSKAKEDTEMDIVDSDDEVLDRGNNSQLRHLSELGLKAVTIEDDEEVEESGELEENEAEELEDNGELDEEAEAIGKLLDEEEDSSSDGDEDFYCSAAASPSEQPRRSKRLCSSYTNDSDCSSPAREDEQKIPRRRSSRRAAGLTPGETSEHNTRQKRKSVRSNPGEEAHSDVENEEDSNPAGGDEGSEAACPTDESTVVATCYCEAPSNVYAAPGDLTEPVFCQAVETSEGARVGCSHGARRAAGTGGAGAGLAPLLRAGPRAPYLLVCALHAAQLRKHMCCPACGLFCTQGIFYQCSKGHLFHLECGLPYNDAKVRPGCPHCGVYSYRWQPANRDCHKVQLQMKCSNKRIFLPDQREQCTPAYLSFSTLSPSQLDTTPVIPEDLLPATPLNLELLCKKREGPEDEDAARKLCDAILAGESLEDLIPKIVSCSALSVAVRGARGSCASCAHAAAARGHVRALHALRQAGAALDAVDRNMRTPLMHAVLELGDKDKKGKEKLKSSPHKDNPEEMEMDVDGEGEGEKVEDKEDKTDDKSDVETDRVKDEDLIKVIRYLVAAGCDVNLTDLEGMTALHMAAQRGAAEACSALAAAPDAALDARDAGGWTPLVWAAENDRADVVRLLLSRGADASSVDEEGNAAVHWCAAAGAARALVQLLRAAPHATHARNAHADTPLHVAARQGHYACVVILLAQGARTDLENSAGELPADVCTGACHSAISLNMQMTLAMGGHVPRRRLLCSDISNGREAFPIPCVNEVDDEPAPDEFTYVTQHVMPHHLHIDDTVETLQGCECKGGDCSAGAGGGECACVTLSVRRWYARGRLRADFPYHDPPMLFECNHTCACNLKKCTNAVVTRARSLGATFVHTEVFRAGGTRGWGLRATRRIARGSPVAAYCGELLPAARADTRAADHYMFALDVKDDLIEQCVDKTQLCVDAAVYGSAARFMNHSCRPNVAPVRVFTACRDLRLPVVTLFATKDVQPGDELTFDYGDKFWSVKSKWMKCECGAPTCRYPVKADMEEAET